MLVLLQSPPTLLDTSCPNDATLQSTKTVTTILNVKSKYLRLATGLDDAVKIESTCTSQPLRLDLVLRRME